MPTEGASEPLAGTGWIWCPLGLHDILLKYCLTKQGHISPSKKEKIGLRADKNGSYFRKSLIHQGSRDQRHNPKIIIILLRCFFGSKIQI